MMKKENDQVNSICVKKKKRVDFGQAEEKEKTQIFERKGSIN